MRSFLDGLLLALRAPCAALAAGALVVACGNATLPSAAPSLPLDAGAAPATAADAGPGSLDAGPGADAGHDAADAAAPVLEAIHRIGRFDLTADGGPGFEWPGTGIVTRFQGTGITLHLDDLGAGGNELDVTLDGNALAPITTTTGAKAYPVASGLPSGLHDLAIFKRTESYVGELKLLPLDVTGGALVPTPPPFAHRIEIVGDSISCGYGVDGADETCTYTPDTESEPEAYGAIAARALSAEHFTVAYSGKGMYRNYDGTTTDTIPLVYGRTLVDRADLAWDFSSWVPDVVVIDLGTNDFHGSDPGQPYIDAYTAFVATVRGHYPGAWIVCALGPMLNDPDLSTARADIKGVVAAKNAAGDARVSFLEFPIQLATDGFACDYHPSRITHKKMGAQLAAAIRALTGW